MTILRWFLFMILPFLGHCVRNKLLTCYISKDAIGNKDLIETLDPHLCTHLMIIGVAVYNNSTFGAVDMSHIKAMQDLRRRNPSLRILLTIFSGGDALSDLCTSDPKLQKLAHFTSNYLNENKLDGLDIDWEFPGDKGRSQDKEGFTRLLKVLSAEFARSKRRLLLTAAVCNNKYIIEKAYDIPQIAKYLDFINLMNYDFHLFSRDTPFLGYNSPLRSKWFEISYLGTINFEWSTNQWLTGGMKPNQIIAGMPFYGRGYLSYFNFCHYVYCPALSPSAKYGTYVPFVETASLIRNGTMQRVWDSESLVPYVHNNAHWISYDDQQSLQLKTQWVVQQNLGGVMVFSLDSDDYRGILGEKWTLLRTINRTLNGYVVPKKSTEISYITLKEDSVL